MSEAKRRQLGPITSIVLGLAACILLLVTILATWMARSLLDTDRVAGAVDRSLQEPVVRDALAEALAEQVNAAIAQAELVERLLPDDLGVAAPLLERALGGFVVDQAADLVSSDRGRELVVAGVTASHRAAIRLLEGEPPELGPVVVESGRVSLDLVPLVVVALGRLQEIGLVSDDLVLPDLEGVTDPGEQIELLEASLDVELDERFGQVVVYENDAAPAASVVGTAQRALRLVRRTLVLLAVVTLLLVVATIATAADRRRTAAWLGLGLAAAGVFAHLVIGRVVDAVPDIIADPDAAAAVRTILSDIVGDLDQTILVLTIGAGALVLALMTVLTRPRGSTSGEGAPSPAWVSSDQLRMGAIAVALVLLLWTGLGVLPVALAAGIVAVGLRASGEPIATAAVAGVDLDG